MNNWQLKTPVVFLIFRRPDITARVFAEIARARPPKLLVVADGPRADRPGEAEKCATARAIIEQVDWPCEVLTNYAETNMGCGRRVSSGLDWAFSLVEEAIILEDDCLPHPTFFRYCEELLERYRDDERVMVVSGDNFQQGKQRTEYSYYFSRYPHCWGWASWRRAWRHYDHEMTLWPFVRDNGWLYDVLQDAQAVAYWSHQFQKTYEGDIDSWNYRWMFNCWTQSGLTALPNVNLVSNIGFGADATHFESKKTPFAHLPCVAISCPVQHPAHVIRDTQADRFTEKNNFGIVQQDENHVKSQKKAVLRWVKKNILSVWSAGNASRLLHSGTSGRGDPMTMVTKKFVSPFISKLKSTYYWYRKPGILRSLEHQLRGVPRYTSGRLTVAGWDLEYVDSLSLTATIDVLLLKKWNDFVARSNAPRILDCGSNIGISVLNYKKHFPGARITAFEPDEKVAAVLRRNLARNNLADVTVVEAAVWKETGVMDFWNEGADAGRLTSAASAKATSKVKTVDIRTYLTEPIDLIKMDIEGAEYEVIAHLADELQLVQNMIIECHIRNDDIASLAGLLQVLAGNDFYVSINSYGPWIDLVHQSVENCYGIHQYALVSAWR